VVGERTRGVYYSKIIPVADKLALYRTKKGWRLFFTKEDLKYVPERVTLIPKEKYWTEIRALKKIHEVM